jgi:hypothetical protein
VSATVTRGPVESPDHEAHRVYEAAYARFQQAFAAARPDLLSTVP